MSTTTEPAALPAVGERLELPFLARLRPLRSTLWAIGARLRNLTATRPTADIDVHLELTFPARIRKFLWLTSGLFSAASMAIPVMGLIAFGRAEGVGTSFLAAVVSACLFGLTSLLHFGPDVA